MITKIVCKHKIGIQTIAFGPQTYSLQKIFFGWYVTLPLKTIVKISKAVKEMTEVVPPSELHLDEDFEKLQNKEKAAAAFAAVAKKK